MRLLTQLIDKCLHQYLTGIGYLNVDTIILHHLTCPFTLGYNIFYLNCLAHSIYTCMRMYYLPFIARIAVWVVIVYLYGTLLMIV